MRPSLFILVALSVSGVHASWFGSDTPAYTSWSKSELQSWLSEHNIDTPSTYSTSQLQALVKSNWDSASASAYTWTQEQYDKAQKSFTGLKETTFDAWDESKLREFLLEQGVVAPSGPREQLVLLAKQKYRGYTSAASSLSVNSGDYVSSASSIASSATSVATSAVVQATKEVARQLDASKDYIYSTWDEGQLRKFLEDKGIVDKKVAAGYTRAELLAKINEGYATVADPVYETWSDSYIREWLIAHGLITPTFDAKRTTLLGTMKYYYYSLTDTAHSSWSDSDLKTWAVQHNLVKSDAQVNREKLQSLVSDNYLAAHDTFWGAWSDSDLKAWLVANGYMRSDAQVKRDELVGAISDKWTDASAKTAAYLTWPDARLRAYLREQGISEKALPTSRPGLLQETRIRWIQTTTRADNLYATIKDTINSKVASAEEALAHILELLTGYTSEKTAQGQKYANEKAAEASASASSASKWASGSAISASKEASKSASSVSKSGASASANAREKVGEKVKQAGQKIKGEL